MQALPTPQGPQRFREEFRAYCWEEWHHNLPAGFRLPLWLIYEEPLEHLLVSESASNSERGAE